MFFLFFFLTGSAGQNRRDILFLILPVTKESETLHTKRIGSFQKVWSLSGIRKYRISSPLLYHSTDEGIAGAGKTALFNRYILDRSNEALEAVLRLFEKHKQDSKRSLLDNYTARMHELRSTFRDSFILIDALDELSISADANVNATSSDLNSGRDFLRTSARHNAARQLVDSLLRPSIASETSSENRIHGWAPLHAACHDRGLGVIKFLLERVARKGDFGLPKPKQVAHRSRTQWNMGDNRNLVPDTEVSESKFKLGNISRKSDIFSLACVFAEVRTITVLKNAYKHPSRYPTLSNYWLLRATSFRNLGNIISRDASRLLKLFSPIFFARVAGAASDCESTHDFVDRSGLVKLDHFYPSAQILDRVPRYLVNVSLSLSAPRSYVVNSF